ncbi:MAG: glycosyltransferase family 39 protein [Candidatus ainarchaeum sp.]|nr:glycosyltransferase family 39 protein [Candidatus ainarchaeum sp.]
MKLSDKVTSLLKEEDYSFEELKQKTNADFFELKDTIKELLKQKEIFKQGFPTKYSLTKNPSKILVNNYVKNFADYKEIFLIITTGLLLVLLYSVFLKNPFLYPGLEQRTFLLFLPLLLITLLLYVPWSKVINIIPKNIIPKETFLFLDKAKHLTSIKELKQYLKEFSSKILVPYYPHLLIILSVFSLFEIGFFSSFNNFFSPIALYLILISIGLIILKQKKPSFFKEKDFCKYSFLLLLILVTLSSLSFEQITFISEPLKAMQFQLTIFTIILGAITFYQNKEVIEEIEEEQNTEEKAEEKRAKEFSGKYPKLAGIPVVSSITKWMYKEGWGYSILIILVLFLFLSFTLPGLGNFITRDEPRWINWFDRGMIPTNSLEQSLDRTFVDNSYGRSIIYWNSYLSGNFVGTLIIDEGSGITTSLLHLPAYLFYHGRSIEVYLLISRVPFVIFNFLLLILSYFLIKKLFSKRSALLFLISMGLFPIFTAFSRIVNHDSINGLLIFTFFLSLLIGIKNNNYKYFILSGFLYSLSLLTSGKAGFIVPLFFISPIIIWLYCEKQNSIKIFINNLFNFFSIAIITFCLFLPAAFIYPQLIFSKLFFPENELTIFVCLSIIFILLLMENKNNLKNSIKKIFEKINNFFVRLFLIFIFAFSVFIYFNRFGIIEKFLWERHQFFEALQGTFASFIFVIPTIILIFLVIKIIFEVIKPRKNLSQFFCILFFIILVGSVFFTLNQFGFFTVYSKYQLLFIPFIIVYLCFNNFLEKLSKIKFYNICIFFIFILCFNNFLYFPNQIFYTNDLYDSEYILFNYSWGIGAYETADFVNNLSNSKLIIINDYFGHLSKFLNNNVYATNDFDSATHIIIYQFNPSYTRFFQKNNFLIEKMNDDDWLLVWEYKINKYDSLVSVFEKST